MIVNGCAIVNKYNKQFKDSFMKVSELLESTTQLDIKPWLVQQKEDGTWSDVSQHDYRTEAKSAVRSLENDYPNDLYRVTKNPKFKG